LRTKDKETLNIRNKFSDSNNNKQLRHREPSFRSRKEPSKLKEEEFNSRDSDREGDK
jgi:hypothetical protein